jgi:hypothetical protein
MHLFPRGAEERSSMSHSTNTPVDRNAFESPPPPESKYMYTHTHYRFVSLQIKTYTNIWIWFIIKSTSSFQSNCWTLRFICHFSFHYGAASASSPCFHSNTVGVKWLLCCLLPWSEEEMFLVVSVTRVFRRHWRDSSQTCDYCKESQWVMINVAVHVC